MEGGCPHPRAIPRSRWFDMFQLRQGMAWHDRSMRIVAPCQVISETLVANADDGTLPRVEEENGFPIIRLQEPYPVTSEDVARILSESE